MKGGRINQLTSETLASRAIANGKAEIHRGEVSSLNFESAMQSLISPFISEHIQVLKVG